MKSKEANDIPEYQQYVDMGIEMVTGSHPDELFERDFDFVIKNPGINYHKPFILRLKQRQIPVYTEIELAFQVAKKQHYIGVTGTNGKTTTVTLIDKILKVNIQMFIWLAMLVILYVILLWIIICWKKKITMWLLK
ncbi:Mur ligase family protein [Coprobacillaceae bacterium CR2/5/TPMF4]|nr:Mur ligase family protein [Coprobacillaceae bacterium CR2/5/TPMF4]